MRFYPKVLIAVFSAYLATSLLLPIEARAQAQVVVGAQQTGPTPFIKLVSANVSGGTLASVAFGIVPKSGSFTRPITAYYSASYLSSKGFLTGSDVTVPVFGLYAGTTNTVGLVFTFTDGTVVNPYVTINTDSCGSPCSLFSSPSLQQNRQATSDLSFDYYLLKDYASSSSPAILDTDGNVRWTGFANVGVQTSTFSTLYQNGIYSSDGGTGLLRMELYGGVTKIGDYAGYSVTDTTQHNMDPGRNGLLIEVNTKTQYEATAIEVDGNSGNLLNSWDMSQIIGAAMTAGGDDPSQFIIPSNPSNLGSSDWFHMNAATYNPADNTLIVSSRENFVVAVDYDTPSDGVKKIHWILGDPTKKWYVQFPSLRRFALQLSSGTLPPLGQHAVSIDLSGNLLLFDDGYGSALQSPPGETRYYSAARSYQINTAAMTATEVFTYAPQNPTIYTPVCGSVYQTAPGNYLIDFPDVSKDGGTIVELQGLGTSNRVVFDLQFPSPQVCGTGWNALPLLRSLFLYQ